MPSLKSRTLNAECPLNPESIRKLFEQVRKGKLTPDDAVSRLRHLPFEDLGFAKVDHHRALRAGMPEVILGQGKTPAQVAEIFARLAKHGSNVLATRASEKQFAAVKKKFAARNIITSLAPSFCNVIPRNTARASSP